MKIHHKKFVNGANDVVKLTARISSLVLLFLPLPEKFWRYGSPMSTDNANGHTLWSDNVWTDDGQDEVVFVPADEQLAEKARQYQEARRKGVDPLSEFRLQLERQKVHRVHPRSANNRDLRQ